jgi:FlgD Ig-like domain
VAWRTDVSGIGHIWAQRLDAAGVGQWVGGSDVALSEEVPGLIPDGAGGAIATLLQYPEDDPFHTSSDIYAQRIDATGVLQWPDSLAVTAAAGRQDHVAAASDGAGGVIVTWEDDRNGTVDVYAQRMHSSGAPMWTADGVAVCTATDDQEQPAIVAVGVGVGVVAWHDRRIGASRDIYAQQVTASPNAVAITSFEVTALAGGVELQATFRSDLGVRMINVYRASGTSGNPFTLIGRVDEPGGEGFQYVDREVVPGRTYRYTIGVLDADGEFFSPTVTVTVREMAGWLGQNQPNPFNPTTTIQFVLPSRGPVRLAVYSAAGQLVRTLVDDVRAPGQHDVVWDGRDDHGAVVGSGVYFYRLTAGKWAETKKMVLLK